MNKKNEGKNKRKQPTNINSNDLSTTIGGEMVTASDILLATTTPTKNVEKKLTIKKKAKFRPKASDIQLATTTPTKNDEKKLTIKKKAKFRPKVMSNSPMIITPSLVSASMSSCRRVLNFDNCEVVKMMVFTQGGFWFTRKINKYIKPTDDHQLQNSSLEGNKKEEEECWQNEQELFRQRALSFIGSTRLVQGNRPFMGWKGSVVDSVVGAFLAQNVADSMSSSAFMSLAAKYPKVNMIGDNETEHAIDWNAVRCAKSIDISRVIQLRGMNNRIAIRIQDFLNSIHDDKSGILDLEWLRNAKQGEAIDYFMGVYGLGLKSMECLRLLTLRQRAFPVDTHVSRIVVRLGWVPIEKLPDGVHIHQLKEYPVMNHVQEYLSQRLSDLDAETLYELHYQMITFGKVFCTKKKPKCYSCPLKTDCRHFASEFSRVPEQVENAFIPVTPGGPSTPVSHEPLLSIPSRKLDDIEDLYLGPKVHKLKNAGRLRTEHQVYELPDSHPLVQALDKRDSGDKNPYLLAIWPPGETQNPSECFSVKPNHSHEEEEMVFGTLLVPCRTATRGSFPFDGTFFQINEVFSDDESSEKQLVVPRKLLLDLTTKTLSCGTSITAIFEGMSTQEIQDCFWEGYVCIRGFNMKTREPRPLHHQFHDAFTKTLKVNEKGKSPSKRRTKKMMEADK